MEDRSFALLPSASPFLGGPCSTGLVPSGGPGESLALSSPVRPQRLLEDYRLLLGVALPGHASPSGLRGFPHYGVVAETERITEMSSWSLREWEMKQKE